MNKKFAFICVISILVFQLLFINAFALSVDNVPLPRISVFSEKEDTSVNKEYKYITKLLEYLEIIRETDDVNYSKIATKGYAAAVIARAFEIVGEASEIPYSDMDENTEFLNEIASMKSVGAIFSSDGNFNSESKITKKELCYMAVKIIGIDWVNDLDSAYAEALKFGIAQMFSGIEDEDLTCETVHIFVYNLLNIEKFEFTQLTETGNSKERGETQLYDMGIIKLDGIITGVGYSTLYGNEVSEGKIEINRSEFDCTINLDISDVGKKVVAFVDANNNAETVVSIEYGKNTITEIEYGKVSRCENSRVLYKRENNSERSVKIADNARLLFNGVGKGLYSTYKNLITKETAVILIDNSGDSVADVVCVEKSEYAVVDSVSEYSSFVNLMYGKDRLEFNNSNKKVILTKDNKNIEFGDLLKWDTLRIKRVFLNSGTEVISAVVSSKKISGILNEIKSENSEEIYRIGKTSYKLTSEFIEFMKNNTSEEKPSVGKKSTFYISDDGKIVAASSAASAFSYGYFMGHDKADALSERIIVQIYTLNDDEAMVYELADKLTFYDADNGIYGEYKKKESILNYLKKGENPRYAVVGYVLNDEEKISELAFETDRCGYTPSSMNYPVIKNYEATGTNGYKNAEGNLYNNVLGSSWFLSGSTKILYIPDNESDFSDIERYSTGKVSDYASDYYFINDIARVYNASEVYVGSFMVVSGGSSKGDSVTPENKAYMVKETYIAVSDDGEQLKAITLINEMGTEQKFLISEEATLVRDRSAGNTSITGYWWGVDENSLNNLKAGDIIQYETDYKKQICSVRILFREANRGDFRSQRMETELKEPANSKYNGNIMVVYGEVVALDDKKSSVIVNTDPTGEKRPEYNISCFLTGYGERIGRYLYDSSAEKSVFASSSEVQLGDTVVVRKRWNAALDLFILR